jgi:hypothetical protein
VAADSSLSPGSTAWYAALAFDDAGRTLAASTTQSATGKAVATIGGFSATPAPGGASLAWTSLAVPESCFSWYKVTWIDAAVGKDPSYASGPYDGAVAITPRTASGTELSLPTGTYRIRVEAFAQTSAGKLLVARSEVRQVEVP